MAQVVTPCWPFPGSKTKGGYGLATIGKRGVDRRTVLVHRATYEAFYGPVPEGLELDHLCRNRACMRPDHMEPVTGRENKMRGQSFSALNARKTVCSQGHPYDEENTYHYHGERRCLICKRADWHRWKARGKAG